MYFMFEKTKKDFQFIQIHDYFRIILVDLDIPSIIDFSK